MQSKDRCIYPGELLIPAPGVDPTTWACVACDQYTSQPAYWEEVKLLVGDKPSTLNLTIPECYLDEAETRIPVIHETMRRYLADGTLTAGVGQGFILTERNTSSGARVGLVCLVDLECYDTRPQSRGLVRPSEGTIQSRIPPRLKIREHAALETSHALLLMDDPQHTVVEPLFARRHELAKLYDFPLMMNGGHLTGYAVTAPDDLNAVYSALDQLRARMNADNALLFAVGDGNHSLATAKANWERVKSGLTPAQTVSHPARFMLVEIENLHDDALLFRPIHRVLFGYDGDDLLDELTRYAAARGASVGAGDEERTVRVVYEGKEAQVSLPGGEHGLAVGALQAFLDDWLGAHPAVRLDYVHGEQAVRELVKGQNAVGFLLPKPEKNDFFPSLLADGALPRKTFSLGEADQKRYYMECRRL